MDRCKLGIFLVIVLVGGSVNGSNDGGREVYPSKFFLSAYLQRLKFALRQSKKIIKDGYALELERRKLGNELPSLINKVEVTDFEPDSMNPSDRQLVAKRLNALKEAKKIQEHITFLENRMDFYKVRIKSQIAKMGKDASQEVKALLGSLQVFIENLKDEYEGKKRIFKQKARELDISKEPVQVVAPELTAQPKKRMLSPKREMPKEKKPTLFQKMFGRAPTDVKFIKQLDARWNVVSGKYRDLRKRSGSRYSGDFDRVRGKMHNVAFLLYDRDKKALVLKSYISNRNIEKIEKLLHDIDQDLTMLKKKIDEASGLPW